MTTYIALFRGINVGGRNTLPMQVLVEVLEECGCRDVSTYIQSGNAVFRVDDSGASALGEAIAAGVLKRRGFRPSVMLIPAAELESIIGQCPFHTDDGKALHFFFLESAPASTRLDELERLKKDSEAFALIGRTLYLYAPEGIGRSKLAAKAEQALGVPATARNWNTVRKLAAMAAVNM